jgi:hypothetical protein
VHRYAPTCVMAPLVGSWLDSHPRDEAIRAI